MKDSDRVHRVGSGSPFGLSRQKNDSGLAMALKNEPTMGAGPESPGGKLRRMTM